MFARMSDFLSELSWRDLLYQQTEGAAAHFAAGPVTAYCGFDPTASSLHVGNLVPIMGLVHLQRAGHRPVALVGGGTGMIGDPSGKASERQLLGLDEIDANVAGIREQLGRFLDFSGERGAQLVDNGEWLRSLRAVDFMRDVGKHFTINLMLQKDSVKSRLDGGISYTEFSYMLLQAYDFLELHRRFGVSAQIGGSDQWGNITAGTELIRRTVQREAHGVTLPLVTTTSGAKFGKSEAGAVWLDATRTSPYKFYQFWVNTEDADAVRFLKMFTLLGREEIDALAAAVTAAPHERAAQRRLAAEVTALVHGRPAAELAERVSKVIFDKRVDVRELPLEVFQTLGAEIPCARFPAGHALAVLDALEQAFGLSRSASRKLIQQGAVSVNGEKLSAETTHIDFAGAAYERWFLVRKGAREVAVLELVD
ncbi:MAG: tyrosine--tRNA ligase [Gemmatimonadetes bacterium]|nr:tyrosine--tRNA ligase [Gemmatimonadota bacterium]